LRRSLFIGVKARRGSSVWCYNSLHRKMRPVPNKNALRTK
jgi:hypothetical protein